MELKALRKGQKRHSPSYSQRVHVADGPAGHDGVRHRFLKLPGRRQGSGGIKPTACQQPCWRRRPRQKSPHLIARYMGRMAKSGKVWTLIMMVMKAM